MRRFMKKMEVDMTHNTYRFSIPLLLGLFFFQLFFFSARADAAGGDQWEFQLAPYA